MGMTTSIPSETAASQKEKEAHITNNNDDNNSVDNGLESFISIAREKGFEIEENKDYGAGPIDLVWNITTHPALPKIKCGFVVLRKIEEAVLRGLRSGMDKTYLVVDNEEMAKSVSGKIEWLASFGSIIRLDSISLGLYPEQKEPAIIKPSQECVPEGEKLRRDETKRREI
jgi:hypothetical protein